MYKNVIKKVEKDSIKEWHDNWFNTILENRMIISSYASSINWQSISKNANLLPEHIEQHPELPWYWNFIASNPNLTFEFINHFISIGKFSKKIIIEKLALNPVITPTILEKLIEKHPSIKWEYSYLSKNTSFKEDWIRSHLDYNWDWEQLATRLHYSFFFYKDVIEALENNYKLCYNYNDCDELIGDNIIDDNFIGDNFIGDNLIDSCDHIDDDWLFQSFSVNPTVTSDFIEKNLNKKWNWDNVLMYTAISAEYIEKIDKYDKWKLYSFNPTINPLFVINNINYNWKWWYLSKKPEMYEWIKKYSYYPWEWSYVSSNPLVTYDFVMEHLNKQWDWKKLFKYTSIMFDETKSIFLELIYNDLSLYGDTLLSSNPYFSINHIEKYNKKIKIGNQHIYDVCLWMGFCNNSLSFSKDIFIENKMKDIVFDYIRNVVHHELIGYIYHPDRLKWIMDDEQYQRWSTV